LAIVIGCLAKDCLLDGRVRSKRKEVGPDGETLLPAVRFGLEDRLVFLLGLVARDAAVGRLELGAATLLAAAVDGIVFLVCVLALACRPPLMDVEALPAGHPPLPYFFGPTGDMVEEAALARLATHSAFAHCKLKKLSAALSRLKDELVASGARHER